MTLIDSRGRKIDHLQHALNVCHRGLTMEPAKRKKICVFSYATVGWDTLRFASAAITALADFVLG
jgi:hypothetical protein